MKAIPWMIIAAMLGIAHAQEPPVVSRESAPDSKISKPQEINKLKLAIRDQEIKVEKLQKLVEICLIRIKSPDAKEVSIAGTEQVSGKVGGLHESSETDKQAVGDRSHVDKDNPGVEVRALDVSDGATGPKISRGKDSVLFLESKKDYENSREMLHQMMLKLVREEFRLKDVKDDEMVPYPPGVMELKSQGICGDEIKWKYIRNIRSAIRDQTAMVADRRNMFISANRELYISNFIDDKPSDSLFKAQLDEIEASQKLEHLNAQLAEKTGKEKIMNR